MEKRTNYGKIFAVTLAVVAGFTAIAIVVYKLFVKDLAKVYAHDEDCDELFAEGDDSCECECVQCDEPAADAPDGAVEG